MVASQHFVPVLRGRSCQGGVYVGKIGYIHRPWNVARPPAPEMSIATVVQFRKQTIYDGDTRLSQGGQDLLFAGQPPLLRADGKGGRLWALDVPGHLQRTGHAALDGASAVPAGHTKGVVSKVVTFA